MLIVFLIIFFRHIGHEEFDFFHSVMQALQNVCVQDNLTGALNISKHIEHIRYFGVLLGFKHLLDIFELFFYN